VQAHFYGSGHAFFNDSRPEAYAADDARSAFSRTTSFLREALA
jgi:carboxymethylenebutenolidase